MEQINADKNTTLALWPALRQIVNAVHTRTGVRRALRFLSCAHLDITSS
jgi:hypothetical protein